ncbi:MAG: hypothetical protein EBU90_25275 [Proteobacteria bacterium]|nr:hypothetical protein [Pseudomonadota bacterium]
MGKGGAAATAAAAAAPQGQGSATTPLGKGGTAAAAVATMPRWSTLQWKRRWRLGRVVSLSAHPTASTAAWGGSPHSRPPRWSAATCAGTMALTGCAGPATRRCARTATPSVPIAPTAALARAASCRRRLGL